MKNAIGLAALIGVLSLSQTYGESSKATKVKQETQEMSRDAGRGMKRTGRAIKDKTCELFNSKGECAVKKGVNSVRNGSDKIEDAVD